LIGLFTLRIPPSEQLQWAVGLVSDEHEIKKRKPDVFLPSRYRIDSESLILRSAPPAPALIKNADLKPAPLALFAA
jgi:hypothetical protein